ncbi:MAG: HNH endonuclease family protein, partial [bacterium]|nr:HNH endonuclease family protein [bacterium]
KNIINDKHPELRDLFVLERMAVFFPLIIKCYKLDKSEFKTDFYEIMKLLEIFSFRVYGIGRKPSYTGRDKLYSFAKKFSGDFEKLKLELRKLILWYVNDLSFKEKLSSPNLYTERRSSTDLKYLFWKYENYLRESTQPKTAAMSEAEFSTQNHKYKLTIEHIASQNPKVTDELVLPEFSREFEENYLHSIGNLTFDPNSANASKGNVAIQLKSSKYFVKAPFKTQNELTDFIEVNKWSRNSIKRRAEKIIEFAMNRWNPLEIAGKELDEKYANEESEESAENSPSKYKHRNIMKSLIKILNEKYLGWASGFHFRNEDKFKLYQSRNGYSTATYIRWKYHDCHLQLKFVLYYDDVEEAFEVFSYLESLRKSEKLSYRFTSPDIIESLEKLSYDNESTSEEKPVFKKEIIIIRKVDFEIVRDQIIQEFENIKPVIEMILK